MTRSILWRRLDLPGHEACFLQPVEGGWELSGTAVFADREETCVLAYRIACDPAWHTVAAEIGGRIGERRVELAVAARDGRWWLDGAEQPAVAGCIDLDLGFSPSTNLLPIRRLALAVGEQAPVRAAWLPFPELAFQPLEQLYRREGPTAYRYESAGGRFVRTLTVDEEGLVTLYPGLWQAERTG